MEGNLSPIAPSLKDQGGSAPVMHPRSGVPGRSIVPATNGSQRVGGCNPVLTCSATVTCSHKTEPKVTVV